MKARCLDFNEKNGNCFGDLMSQFLQLANYFDKNKTFFLYNILGTVEIYYSFSIFGAM